MKPLEEIQHHMGRFAPNNSFPIASRGEENLGVFPFVTFDLGSAPTVNLLTILKTTVEFWRAAPHELGKISTVTVAVRTPPSVPLTRWRCLIVPKSMRH